MFIRLGENEIINLDSVSYARLNFDGAGAVAIQLGSGGRMSDREAGMLTTVQQNVVTPTLRVYRGEDARLLTEIFLAVAVVGQSAAVAAAGAESAV